MRDKRILALPLCILAFVALRMSVSADSAGTLQPGTDPVTTPAAELTAPDQYTLIGTRNLLSDIDATAAGGSRVHVVVEIPAGSVDKWEVDKHDGSLRWEMRDGKPRQVRYLGYPGNYGMIPRTLLPAEEGGDGDPLDVLVLGPAVPRGSVVEATVIAVLRMLDGGERDDKLLAVLSETAFADATNLEELQMKFPGVTDIVETWFAHYKGPGKIQTRGYGDVEDATRILEAAVRAFEAHAGAPQPVTRGE